MASSRDQWVLRFATSVWCVWRMRNEVVFNQVQWDLGQIQRWVDSNLHDNVMAALDDDTSPRSCDNPCWLFPAFGWVKFNVDGSVWDTGEAACGGVLRDCSRHWIHGFCRILGTSNHLLAELWAIRTTLDVLGNIFAVISSSARLVSPYRDLVGAIRRAMPPGVDIRFRHVLREANSVADSLAKAAHVFGFVTQVLQSPLAECRHLLYQDANGALASLYLPIA